MQSVTAVASRLPVEPITIRSYQPGDEASICELYRTVFGRPLTLAQWRWRHLDNPYSRPMVHVAVEPDGRVIAHFALVSAPLRCGGSRTRGALSIQSMVHPAWQRRGLLSRLAHNAERQLKEEGVQVACAFLNDNSRHAYTERFGWTANGGASFIFFRVLDPANVLQRTASWSRLSPLIPLVTPVADLVFRARSTPRSFTVHELTRFDQRVDDLWSRAAPSTGTFVERDAGYLNWRIADKPDDYRSLVCADGYGRLRGLVVTKYEQRFGVMLGYVVELLIDPRDPEVGPALLGRAVDGLREQGCAMVSALTMGSESVRLALTEAGFRRLPWAATPHRIHFCHKPISRPPSRDAGWFLSWLDHDVI